MKRAAQNPAVKNFGQLLPASGLYPQKWVDVFTSSNDDLKITDVEVVFIPRDLAPAPSSDDGARFWGAFTKYNSRWDGDLGNSCSDWLEPGGLNPASLFGYLLFRGFVDERVLEQAVREFSQIEECDWARDMLEGMKPE